MVLGQQPSSYANSHNKDLINGLSTTKFVILALLICVVVVIICLAVYIIKNPVVRSIGVVYTHCSEKPLNLPHRKAFSTLGIKFISPDEIFNLAQQQGLEPQKIIYIPCSYNNSDPDIQAFFRGKKLLNDGKGMRWLSAAVLGCNKLCSKNGLWSVLETTYGRKNATQIMPESWVIPVETTGNQLLIVKPGTAKSLPALIFKKNIQGKQGLLLTNSPAEIKKLIGDSPGPNDKYSVVQRYLEQPYLIHGRKLNIRLYVLVVVSRSVSSWWLYHAGKCIYTNRQYEPLPSGTTIRSGATGGIELLEQHFTSLNLDPVKVYQEERCPETLAELQEYMLQREENWPKIWKKIQLGLQKVARAYTRKLTSYPGSVAYQIFGVDYVLTQQPGNGIGQITPYLLEFNKGPEMKYKSPHDKELKSGLQQDILEHVLGQQQQQDGIVESKILLHSNFSPLISNQHPYGVYNNLRLDGKWLLLNSVNKSKTNNITKTTHKK